MGAPVGRGPRGRLTASRAWKNSPSKSTCSPAQQRLDDRHRLLEAADPVIEGIAERVVLRLVPPCAETEDDPTPADVVDRLGHLGDETRIAEPGAGHQRPDLDALRGAGQTGHGREALPDATVLFIGGYLELATGLRPKHEVVDDPDRVKAGVFGRARHGQDVGKVGRAPERGVLGDRQDDSDAHRAIAGRPAAFRGGCHRAGSVPVPALRHRSPPARLRGPMTSRG